MTPPTRGDSSHSRSSGAIDVPRRSIINGPSDIGSSLPSFDVDDRAGWHEIEQLDDVPVGHANAPDRARDAEGLGVRGAVDIDVAAHCIDIAEAVLADL